MKILLQEFTPTEKKEQWVDVPTDLQEQVTKKGWPDAICVTSHEQDGNVSKTIPELYTLEDWSGFNTANYTKVPHPLFLVCPSSPDSSSVSSSEQP